MTEQKLRLVLCMGKNCNARGDAEPLYERLVARLGEPHDFRSKALARWEIANCLNLCGSGPNLMLFPHFIHYDRTTLKKMDRIIDEFIAYDQNLQANEDSSDSP